MDPYDAIALNTISRIAQLQRDPILFGCGCDDGTAPQATLVSRYFAILMHHAAEKDLNTHGRCVVTRE